ncbi:type II toxin-antitoxin system RelB family antitoxin [Corynebacterium cystitidis]|uniref:Ribbon-helix-helix protein, copG family n=1 Tax=Corynebacterium cystitidis DSM 20524 TaxID=1121357 RepID=A0A1H9U6B6_9CORY|nr:DUF6290 family protein [Corynebacterium cystitidis]WJY81191.1 hypothetical protein CCYS_01040 [Corynebacterium cystitidis DSM 20524]SES04791.1 hypothetical protein SAMN05661109_01678 [Corynebacterium cystitidis DSM 20524]SNV89556.1 Uncharacterised protein [Corynebacterium cystitidis]
MNTLTVRMSDDEATLVRKFAGSKNVTMSDFARSAILEKIEDAYGLEQLRDAIANDDGKRYGIDEVLGEL